MRQSFDQLCTQISLTSQRVLSVAGLERRTFLREGSDLNTELFVLIGNEKKSSKFLGNRARIRINRSATTESTLANGLQRPIPNAIMAHEDAGQFEDYDHQVDEEAAVDPGNDEEAVSAPEQQPDELHIFDDV